MKVRKAIIPAAGLGTRMLPATKALPKEMLPIVDKPVIQYVVEEAVNAGITDILIVVGKGKRAIEEHFYRDLEKEILLKGKGKTALADSLREIADLANIHFVWQQEQNGLGDAIRYGKQHVGDEPFAVLLGDSIIESYNNTPVLKQMVEQFEKNQSSIVAVTEVPREIVNRYGVMSGEKTDTSNVFKVNDWVEKPAIEDAPSNLVVSGLYILTAKIFELLEDLPRGIGNEIQLTDAMRLLLKTEEMYAYHYDGKRYDIGNKLDFIKTNLLFGLRDENMKEDLREWLKTLS